LINAGTSSYPAAWPGTWAVASYGDRSAWFRTPTSYDTETGELCVTVDVEAGQPCLLLATYMSSKSFNLPLFVDLLFLDLRMHDICNARSRYVYVAYFAPFSYEQHLSLVADCAAAKDTDGSALCSVTQVHTQPAVMHQPSSGMHWRITKCMLQRAYFD